MKNNLLVLPFLMLISCSTPQENKDQIFQEGNQAKKGIYTKKVGDLLYTYNNGILNGPYKAFYENGSLWAEGNYDNGQLNGAFKTYTPDKKLAVDEEWKGGTLYYQKIYWQPIINDEKKFLFVSNEGFVMLENGIYVNLDEKTPDNIMQIGNRGELYIWKKGKKVLYAKGS